MAQEGTPCEERSRRDLLRRSLLRYSRQHALRRNDQLGQRKGEEMKPLSSYHFVPLVNRMGRSPFLCGTRRGGIAMDAAHFPVKQRPGKGQFRSAPTGREVGGRGNSQPSSIIRGTMSRSSCMPSADARAFLAAPFLTRSFSKTRQSTYSLPPSDNSQILYLQW